MKHNRLANYPERYGGILSGGLFLSGYKDGWDPSLKQPPCRCRPCRTINKVNIDQSAIHFELIDAGLEFGKTAKEPDKDVTEILDHGLNMEDNERIVFQVENAECGL